MSGFSLAPTPVFHVLLSVYGLIGVSSLGAELLPSLRGERGRRVRLAVHGWWPTALATGALVAFGAWPAAALLAVVMGQVLVEFLAIARLPSGLSASGEFMSAGGAASSPPRFAAGLSASGEVAVAPPLTVEGQIVARLAPVPAVLAALGWGVTGHLVATAGVAVLLALWGAARGLRPVLVAAGVLLAVGALGHLMVLLAGPSGPGRAGFLLLVVMWSDAGQFVVGKAVGRHKLVPRLSPGKTWEGLMGGLVFAGLAGALAASPLLGASATTGLAAAAVLTALGLAGDLSISALKRRAGVKDTGTLVPGQGGVLDRCDSLLLAAPLATWLALTA